MGEASAIPNRRIISNKEDDITNRREPLFLPDFNRTLPLLRLEDACQPLFDPQLYGSRLREKINLAYSRSNVDNLLTIDEQASLYLYTMEWRDEPQNSFYAKINYILRTGDGNLLGPWLGYLHLFTSALLKLPSTETTVVHRCVQGHVSDQYQKDNMHVLLSFTSCITSFDELLSNISSIGPCTVISIRTSAGKLIERYGGVKGEILLLPGSHFHVVKINNTSVMQKIELDETPSKTVYRQDLASQDVAIRQRKQQDQSQQATNVLQYSANKAPESKGNWADFTTTISDTVWWKKPKTIIAVIISLILLVILALLLNNFIPSTSDNAVLNQKEQKPIPVKNQYEEDGKKHQRRTLKFADGRKYEGEVINNTPDGEGVLTWPNGDQYKGPFLLGLRHGHGTLTYSNGDQYVGNWFSDKEDGNGIKTWSNGDKYEGQWKNSKFYGHGTLFRSNKDKYTGVWVNGKKDGQGVYVWSNGDKYEGSWKNDEQHGYGIIVYQNGNKYEGHWDKNQKNGEGVYTWASGSQYNGSWKNDEQHGYGIYLYYTGDKYEGHWDKNRRDGEGVYAWASGSQYNGSWKNDQQHGKGAYVYTSGDKYEGDWDNSKKSGEGVYTWTNGNRYSGSWKNDRQNGNGTYIYRNGDKYEGYWEDDQKKGYGIYTWADGNRYVGNWENNKMHGYGEMFYTNGEKLACTWNAGKCTD